MTPKEYYLNLYESIIDYVAGATDHVCDYNAHKIIELMVNQIKINLTGPELEWWDEVLKSKEDV